MKSACASQLLPIHGLTHWEDISSIFLDRNLPKALFYPHFRVKSALQSENRLFS